MRGLMMTYPLTVPAIVRRVDSLFGDRPVVSRQPDRVVVRTTYAGVVDRARRLAVALRALGVEPGDRVATLGWNHQTHLEAYLAVPSIAAVLHTLNLRLHPDDLAYIVNDAHDRVLIVDESLVPLYESFRSRVDVERVIVVGRDYEDLVASADPAAYVEPELDEETAAAMCYTSGTTGRPKGVLYSHRAIVLHAFGHGLVDAFGISAHDTVLPIVPMFHVNAWGLPFSCTLFGAAQVLPGPYLDAPSLLDLIEAERVTLTAGVPTVFLSILHELDRHPGARDLSALRALVIGGSAAPESMIRAFKERHGLEIVHAWGMTEMTPLGTLCHLPPSMANESPERQYGYRARQGTPLPFVEVRARTETGMAPWDGATMGELEVRGPCVAAQYFNLAGADDRFTDDGWFRTGDIVTIDPGGCIQIADRAKDLVKSGGEWISSVALESALMGHPAVAEAAVVAVPHPKWDERPLAVVVVRPGHAATADELIGFLATRFAKWWLPDAIEFVTEIPRTSVGKFKKSVLREQLKHRYGMGSDEELVP